MRLKQSRRYRGPRPRSSVSGRNRAVCSTQVDGQHACQKQYACQNHPCTVPNDTEVAVQTPVVAAKETDIGTDDRAIAESRSASLCLNRATEGKRVVRQPSNRILRAIVSLRYFADWKSFAELPALPSMVGLSLRLFNLRNWSYPALSDVRHGFLPESPGDFCGDKLLCRRPRVAEVTDASFSAAGRWCHRPDVGSPQHASRRTRDGLWLTTVEAQFSRSSVEWLSMGPKARRVCVASLFFVMRRPFVTGTTGNVCKSISRLRMSIRFNAYLHVLLVGSERQFGGMLPS